MAIWIAVAVAGLAIGLAIALYFKRKGTRSEQERRAKTLSRFLVRDESAEGFDSSGADDGGDD